MFLSSSFSPSPHCVAGEDLADAHVHLDPTCVLGRAVGGEDEPFLSGSALRNHPHHPIAHAPDWWSLFSHGDEMCKYHSLSVPPYSYI